MRKVRQHWGDFIWEILPDILTLSAYKLTKPKKPTMARVTRHCLHQGTEITKKHHVSHQNQQSQIKSLKKERMLVQFWSLLEIDHIHDILQSVSQRWHGYNIL